MCLVRSLAERLQQVLGPSLDQLGRDTRLIRRERKFTGSTLLKTIVLTVMKDPSATPLGYVLTASRLGVPVSPKAIRNRFNAGLVTFLRGVLEGLLEKSFSVPPAVVPLFERFTAVFVGDSTTVGLPDECAGEFPGCGGMSGSGKAALKIQVLWDLKSGRLAKLLLEPGRRHDSRSAALAEPPRAGSLTAYDLAYFDLKRFRKWGAGGAYWISRLQTGTAVFGGDGSPLDLLEQLKRGPSARPFDRWLVLGAAEGLRCRVVALKSPQEVADGRRRKAYAKAQKHGLTPTKEHLEWCDWTVFVTNCSEEVVAWKEVVVLYRSRWQIELMFKLWKSHHGLATSLGRRSPEQRLAELWAKMIGVILQHWLLLTTAWPDARRSLWMAARVIRDRLTLIIDALDDLARLTRKLDDLRVAVAVIARVGTRKKHPSWFQLVLNPELMNWLA
jgi:hypothetical protein